MSIKVDGRTALWDDWVHFWQEKWIIDKFWPALLDDLVKKNLKKRLIHGLFKLFVIDGNRTHVFIWKEVPKLYTIDQRLLTLTMPTNGWFSYMWHVTTDSTLPKLYKTKLVFSNKKI